MNYLDWNNLPIVDWELGKRLAGNQVDLAEDLMSMLTKSLPNEVVIMNELVVQKNYPELLKRVHTLHGAASYCGTPRLKALLGYFERGLLDGGMEEDALSGMVKELGAVVIAFEGVNLKCEG